MDFGNFNNNPILNKKLFESQTDLKYTVSDKVDEKGRYIIEYSGDSEEFFSKLGYYLAEDVEKDFTNIKNEQDI